MDCYHPSRLIDDPSFRARAHTRAHTRAHNRAHTRASSRARGPPIVPNRARVPASLSTSTTRTRSRPWHSSEPLPSYLPPSHTHLCTFASHIAEQLSLIDELPCQNGRVANPASLGCDLHGPIDHLFQRQFADSQASRPIARQSLDSSAISSSSRNGFRCVDVWI